MCNPLWKGFYIAPKRVLPGTKSILHGTSKGSSKFSPMGTAEEAFQVLDSTFFSKSVVHNIISWPIIIVSVWPDRICGGDFLSKPLQNSLERNQTQHIANITLRSAYRLLITGNIHTEIKGRAATFKERASIPEAYNKSRFALWRTIKQAKHLYRTKIEWY